MQLICPECDLINVYTKWEIMNYVCRQTTAQVDQEIKNPICETLEAETVIVEIELKIPCI